MRTSNSHRHHSLHESLSAMRAVTVSGFAHSLALTPCERAAMLIAEFLRMKGAVLRMSPAAQMVWGALRDDGGQSASLVWWVVRALAVPVRSRSSTAAPAAGSPVADRSL